MKRFVYISVNLFEHWNYTYIINICDRQQFRNYASVVVVKSLFPLVFAMLVGSMEHYNIFLKA